MTEQDPTPIVDEAANEASAPAPAPVRRRAQGWVIASALAAVILVGMVWWNGRSSPAAALPEANAVETPVPPAVQSEPRALAALPSATPTAIPSMLAPTPAATKGAATIVLPTVTPTLPPSAIPSRTITFGGNTTLRLMLKNDAFATTGKPVERVIEPRIYALGSEATTVVDHWCMQLGVASLLFDMTFTLNPVNGAVRTTGALNLYDGFCDAVGPLRSSSGVDVEVPADASAELVQSLQTEAHMLGVSDLLNIDTGVFVELVISNTRRQ